MEIGPPLERPEERPTARVPQVPSTEKASASMDLRSNLRVRTSSIVPRPRVGGELMAWREEVLLFVVDVGLCHWEREEGEAVVVVEAAVVVALLASMSMVDGWMVVPALGLIIIREDEYTVLIMTYLPTCNCVYPYHTRPDPT